jgi:hypothetical protein
MTFKAKDNAGVPENGRPRISLGRGEGGTELLGDAGVGSIRAEQIF